MVVTIRDRILGRIALWVPWQVPVLFSVPDAGSRDSNTVPEMSKIETLRLLTDSGSFSSLLIAFLKIKYLEKSKVI